MLGNLFLQVRHYPDWILWSGFGRLGRALRKLRRASRLWRLRWLARFSDAALLRRRRRRCVGHFGVGLGLAQRFHGGVGEDYALGSGLNFES
ncbi:MAG: hypothetical protein QOF70_6696 [Acetobacteraceae bacterium]|nr:hypothetical protein [Acetobacteraceae bacterium]